MKVSVFSSVSITVITLMAGLALAVGPASTHIIYRDNFKGAATTTLDGTAPTVDHGKSAKWKAGSTAGPGHGHGTGVGWQANGSTSLSGNSGGAYLSFTPSSGNIYTLKAKLDPSAGNWLGLGFVKSPNTINPVNGSGAYAWAVVSPGGGGQIFTGPDTTNANGGFTGTSGANKVSIVLNTTAKHWTYRIYDNGKAETPVVVFKTNPAITAVGLGNSGASGTVSGFELSVRKQKK
ncbi:MAG: hypothetical protein ACYCUV_11395 [Phycisphaerae bacterium]